MKRGKIPKQERGKMTITEIEKMFHERQRIFHARMLEQFEGVNSPEMVQVFKTYFKLEENHSLLILKRILELDEVLVLN